MQGPGQQERVPEFVRIDEIHPFRGKTTMFDLRQALDSSVRRSLPGSILVLLTFATLLVGTVQAEELPTLEQALLQQAPRILKFAHEHGYKNVGVLKFRIREGNARPSDRNGLLNRNLAERLELALIVKNQLQSPVGIIHNASDVAATIPGATHLTTEGRPKLFDVRYPLAWGSAKVTPDALLVGAVQVNTDFKTVLIGIAAFGPNDEKLVDVVKFSARLTTNELVELGTSFSTRSAFGGGQVNLSHEERESKAVEAVSKQVALIKTNNVQHPLSQSSAVNLTVYYDGQAIPIEYRDGGAFLKEPTEQQKVSLILQRANPADRTRYAVVLRVNGENTLYRQRLKDLDCSKWILEPGAPPIKVEGFQLNDQQRQQFKVLSKAASKEKEMDYGSDVGTISFVVFQPKGAGTPAPPATDILSDDSDDFAILSRGTFPRKQPQSLEALKSQLALLSKSRGLITEGHTEQSAIRKVTFEADPVPVMAATITYYKP